MKGRWRGLIGRGVSGLGVSERYQLHRSTNKTRGEDGGGRGKVVSRKSRCRWRLYGYLRRRDLGASDLRQRELRCTGLCGSGLVTSRSGQRLSSGFAFCSDFCTVSVVCMICVCIVSALKISTALYSLI